MGISGSRNLPIQCMVSIKATDTSASEVGWKSTSGMCWSGGILILKGIGSRTPPTVFNTVKVFIYALIYTTSLGLFFTKVVVGSAQRVPEPDPLPGISSDTRPDPVQF